MRLKEYFLKLLPLLRMITFNTKISNQPIQYQYVRLKKKNHHTMTGMKLEIMKINIHVILMKINQLQ